MRINMIWAEDLTGAIGRENTLPWRVPEDLRRFKQLTLNCPVIMGRKTYESLPSGPLPNRTNIVVTSKAGSAFPDGVIAVSSLEEAFFAAKNQPGVKECFVIGGSQVYALALASVDTLYRTIVATSTENADAFAPKILEEHFRLVEASDWLVSTGKLDYKFETWDRR